MTGMNKQLAPANGVLRGLPDLGVWVVSKIDAFMCTMFCIYQVYERTQLLCFKQRITLVRLTVFKMDDQVWVLQLVSVIDELLRVVFT